MPQGRRGRPRRPRVWGVDGGWAAVSLAWACVKPQVAMGARWRWDAALEQRPATQSPSKRGPKLTQGKRQRRVHAWAERADPPWETVDVDGYGGQRKPLWGFAHTALGHTPGWPPVELRYVIGGAPEGQLRRAALVWTDVQATPGQIRAWGVRRCSVAVTCAESRAQLGRATQRPWSDQARARPIPLLLALGALSTRLALRLSREGPLPVPVTAWSHQAEPTFSDGVSLGRRPLWRAR
jgi:hypothetical protein